MFGAAEPPAECAPPRRRQFEKNFVNLFQILNLFPHFFDLVFHIERERSDGFIVGFAANRVAFAVKFLHEKIELSAHLIERADLAERLGVRAETGKLFIDVALIGKHRRFR